MRLERELHLDGTEILQSVTPAAATPLARDVSAAQALRIITGSCISQIRNSEPALQSGEPQALHQIRVALRRWRAALTVFDALLTHEGRKLEGELKWLAGETNAARDLDVLAPRLVVLGRDNSAGAEALLEAFSAARTEAYEHMREALRSRRARRLLEGARPSAALLTEGRAYAARELAAEALSHRRRQVRRGGRRLHKLDAQALHRLRIRAKNARYTAELFGELFGHARRQRRSGLSLKALQDALGELNDIHVGAALAAGLAARAGSPDAGFHAGLIAGARACSGKALLARAGKAYDGFVDVPPFW